MLPSYEGAHKQVGTLKDNKPKDLLMEVSKRWFEFLSAEQISLAPFNLN